MTPNHCESSDISADPTTGSGRPGLAALLLLTGGALAIRLVACVRAELIPRDTILFLEQASLLGRGNGSDALSIYQHPLFAAFTAAVHAVLPISLETAGTVVALALGSLAVIPLACLMGAVFCRETGLISGWLYAALPLAVRLTARPLSEGVFHFFLLLAAWAGFRALQGRYRVALAAGLASGLAFLARPEGLVIAAAGGLAVLFLASSRPWPSRITATAALAFGLLVTAGPYVGYLSHQQGRWVLSAKKDVTVLGGIRSENAVQPLSDEGLAGHPVRAAGQLLHHLAESLSYVALGLALIGLIAPGRPRRRGELYLGLIVLLFSILLFRVASTYGYLAKRHTLTLGLFFLGWSGVGVERVAAGIAWLFRLRTPRRDPGEPDTIRATRPARPRAPSGQRPFPLRTGIVLAITLIAFLPVAWKDVDRPHVPLRELGRWIQARLGEGRVIEPLGSGRVAYYARARSVDILSRNQAWWSPVCSTGSFDELRDALERAHVEIVIQSSRQPAPLRQWLETNTRLVHRVYDEKGRRWWAARSFASP